MTPADAWDAAIAAQAERGSNFRLALEAVGGSTRELAAELGVSQRTVQRWGRFESGRGGEGRNPERSPQAGELKAMADVQRDARALEHLAAMEAFEADLDVNYEDEDGEDEGARKGQTMVAPLNLRPVVRMAQEGASRADVGAAFAAALGASYGLPASLVISNIEHLSLQ